MRYQNWDVLIFPGGSKIPVQEFKTSCHVVQDHETGSLVPSSFVLPTVTSFVPGVPAGFSFRVSVHCWDTPEISRYTQNYSKHPENVMYEARIFIDGKISGRRLFQRVGPWPMIIETSLDRDRNGEAVLLRFPAFHAELLHQSHWNAGDDLGRIKVVISEGFPRDSLTMPLERVKNVVCFSFQHAPLEVLENSCIAWPNPTMWQQLPYSSAYLTQQASPSKEELESHSHSPRRHERSLPAPPLNVMRAPHVPPVPIFPRAQSHDLFCDMGSDHRKTSSSDVSMTDGENNRRATELSDEWRQRKNLQSAGAYEQVFEALLPAAPANTPLDNNTPMPGRVKAEASPSSFAAPGSTPDHAEIDPELRGPLFSTGVVGRNENQESPSRLDIISGSRKSSLFPLSNEESEAPTFMDGSGKGSLYECGFKRKRAMDQPLGSPSRNVSAADSVVYNIR